uniref:WIF domain-containing protein n=1 Tax=Schmidtea mediterranea TaxID=79327 RepID=A0A1S6KMJ2_SCHMD|nr:hypothetical protein Smed-wif-like protein [Schmidtea mediterranea]
MSFFDKSCLVILMVVSAISLDDDQFNDLNMWIERQQIIEIINLISIPKANQTYNPKRCPQNKKEAVKDILKETYVIHKGKVDTTSIAKAGLSNFYPIPSQLDVINAQWKAGSQGVFYYVKSESDNQAILFQPLLNISPFGFVPPKSSSIKLTLPCSGKISGKVKVDLSFSFSSPKDRFTPVKAFTLTFYKQCLTTSQRRRLSIKCGCKKHCKRVKIKRIKSKRSLRRKDCMRHCRKKVQLLGLKNALKQ